MTRCVGVIVLLGFAAGAGIERIALFGAGRSNDLCCGEFVCMLLSGYAFGLSLFAYRAGSFPNARSCFGSFLGSFPVRPAMSRSLSVIVLVAVTAGAGVQGVALCCTGRCNSFGGIAMGMCCDRYRFGFRLMAHRAGTLFCACRCSCSLLGCFPLAPAMLDRVYIIRLIAVAASCTLVQCISFCVQVGFTTFVVRL